MDINCGMELHFSEASNLTEPDFTTTGSGLTVNMESSTDDVRTLLDSVTSTCTSTAYRGHYQSDRHLTAADFKLDLGPANDLVSATDLSMENSVTDISDSMMISEECSDGYSIVNAALEGNVAPLKPQVITSSNGNAVNLNGIPLATVLSGIQAIPVIPITNLENIQLYSDGKLVKLNELSLISSDNRLLQNDHKNSLNNVGQSAILLGNVLMLHPGITTQVSGIAQNKPFVSSVDNGNVSQKGTQLCTGQTTLENRNVSQKVTQVCSGLTTVENENFSQKVTQLCTGQKTLENGNAMRQMDQEFTEQTSEENGNVSQKLGEVGSDKYLISDITQRFYVDNQSVLNSNTGVVSSSEHSFNSSSLTSNVNLNIDNTMTLKKSDESHFCDIVPADPLEKTKIMTCGKTIYLTFDCKNHNKTVTKTTAVPVNNSFKVSADTQLDKSAFHSNSETGNHSSLLSAVSPPSEHLCVNSHSSLIGNQTAKTCTSIHLVTSNTNVVSSLRNQTAKVLESESHLPVTSVHVSTSLKSIYSTCSNFPLSTNLKNSLTAVPMMSAYSNSSSVVSTNGLNKPVCSSPLVLNSSDSVAVTSLSSAASMNQFTVPVVLETQTNTMSGSKEITLENHATPSLTSLANQIQVPVSTNQTPVLFKANSVKVSVSEGKSINSVKSSHLNCQTIQNNVLRIVSADQPGNPVPMKNQLMIPVSVSTCQSSISTNQVPISANYVQLPLSIDQVSGLISANKITVPVSANQITVPLQINQTTLPVSTNQMTVPAPANQTTVTLSANKIAAPLLGNQIKVPASTNQIQNPLSDSMKTVTMPTQVVLASKPTVLVSSNQNITVPVSATSTLVSASHVKVPVSVNQFSVPVLPNHLKHLVSGNSLPQVPSDLACLTTPLLVNQFATPESTKINQNLISLNQIKIPVSSQLSVPVSSQNSIPVSSQISVPVTSQISVPVSCQNSIPVTSHISNPVSSQISVPVSSQLSVPVSSQLSVPVSSQISVPVSSQMSVPASSKFIIPVTPNFSAADQLPLTNKTTTKSSQYKPAGRTVITSNQSNISVSSASIQTHVSNKSSSAISSSIASHAVNDYIMNSSTTRAQTTILASLHCSQVQPSLILEDRTVQKDALLTNQSKQTIAVRSTNNKFTDTTNNQNQNSSNSNQLHIQNQFIKDKTVNTNPLVNQGKITPPLNSKMISNLEVKQDNQELIIVPQAENSNYISILGTVKKQKLSTAETPVMLQVKKIESQSPKSGQTDCNEGNKDTRLNATGVTGNFLSSNIEGVIDQQNLDAHMVFLDDAKPFKCDLCSAAFNRMGNYTRHRMIHTVNTKDSYRYKCEECGRLFLQRCDMKRHMLIHSNQEPYRCQECGKGYIRRSDLVVHMRFHRKERAFKCGRCSKEFFQSGDLNRHIRHVHLQSSLLTCGHCNRQFAKEATLIRHIQMKHRDIIIKSLKKTSENKESISEGTDIEEIKEDEAMDYDTSETLKTEAK